MKVKATVTRIEGEKAILSVGDEEVEFPVGILPEVVPGSVLSLKIKVENSHSSERDEETIEVMSALLDRSCKEK